MIPISLQILFMNDFYSHIVATSNYFNISLTTSCIMNNLYYGYKVQLLITFHELSIDQERERIWRFLIDIFAKLRVSIN